jgi:polyhydroxybutyrate depolymerase
MSKRVPMLAALGLLSVAVFSCSESNGGGGSGTGGKGGSPSGSGGAFSSGGATNTGGSGALGGTVGTGGTAASGGAKGTGGVVETGGATMVGGGGTGSGGTKASGGAAAGGRTGAGGGTAGMSGSGGATSSGGSTQTDGGRGDSAAGGAGTGGIGAGGGGTGGGGSSGTGGIGTGGGSGTGGGAGNSGSVTCPSAALKAGDTDKTVQVGSDGARTYRLHVPSGYDGSKPVPLLVDFHGLSGSGQQEESNSPAYKTVTDKDGVIAAYPNGKSGPNGAGWNVGPCCVANVDDVAFAKALVADVEKVACIDPKRVYAVGFSMGGGMSHYIACHAADVFAAVAPAAFDLLKENVDGCKPPRPITVISFRSHGDTFVDYNGAASTYVPGMPITFLGAQETFKRWAQINQCTGSPSAEDSNGCSTYASCGGGVQVTLCSKQGGTHEPGNPDIGWPLLKKYTLP